MKILACKIFDFSWNFKPKNEAYQSISVENDPRTSYAQNYSRILNLGSEWELATGGAPSGDQWSRWKSRKIEFFKNRKIQATRFSSQLHILTNKNF